MNNNSRYGRARSKRKFNNNRSRRGRRGSNRGGNRGRKQSTLDHNLFISKEVEQQQPEKKYTGRSFDEYNLSHPILSNLKKKGFETTTEIQETVMNKIIEGKDVFAISKTGSGKTGAFLIPMIEKLFGRNDQKVLIIAPTRELAMQIRDEAFSMIKGTSIYVSLVIGGENIKKQIRTLKKNPQIIVGTPGRLNDVYQRKALDFSNFNNIILDEVDRMLDMGFVDEMKQIHKLVSNNKQSLFFSATTDKRVESIVKGMIQSYEYVKLSENKPTKSVYQDIVKYQDSSNKIDKLANILVQNDVSKSIIFVETKRYADKVGKLLYKKGHKNGVIHGGKRQNKRKRVLESFRKSQFDVLIATNVAARGIDIDDITHVINLDTPTSYDDYIHRIGRTGRNGKTGNALTFVEKRN